MRVLMQKASPRSDLVDINEAVHEVIELTRGEALKNGVSVKTKFAKDLPIITGDRVQLQQVVSTPCKQWGQLVRTLDRC